jgi:NIMA-interacting peptidyl-prolyl cis-trans isomerase 4
MGKDTKAKQPAAKGGDKGSKGAGKEDKKAEAASKETKGGNSVNVRHILCEKQSK